ncbi:hypothetical protein BT63DRAFT_430364 [Microthyrium microscopicum]|uniref:GET complex, subunit GET2 n=1 Tax=Microthyrium microscopicum TaxID=703497 RepID=A0A6A6TXX9_9PEZI|nr:hypothetical protein BT63DRAFT_430364 [Microthyrium microscopicum]
MESTPIPENETPNQKQARIRREKRQAKIAAGGTDRLNKIIGVQGGRMPEPAPALKSQDSTPSLSRTTSSSHPQAASVEDAPDPAEMDISTHYYEPARRRTPQPQGQSPFGFPGQMDMMQGQPDGNDPMMQMMQQLLSGGAPGEGGAANPELMTSLASLLGGNPQMAQASAQQAQADMQRPTSDRTYIWRIAHAVASMWLALYVVLSSPVRFNGSKEGREMASLGGEAFGAQLFFWFASTEVVLQSSRFFLERGQVQSTGMLGMLSGVIPQPYAGYIRIAMRYSTIFSTIFTDAMVVLFVLGIVAWWNGLGGV